MNDNSINVLSKEEQFYAFKDEQFDENKLNNYNPLNIKPLQMYDEGNIFYCPVSFEQVNNSKNFTNDNINTAIPEVDLLRSSYSKSLELNNLDYTNYFEYITDNNVNSVNNSSVLNIKIHNILSTANLKCELDLYDIASKVKNTEYKPKRFNGVILRTKHPEATISIFKSGKISCQGAKSVEDSRAAARYCAKIIKKLGFNVKFSEFKIHNIVSGFIVNFRINIKKIAEEHSKFSNYEPNMFPGLVYRMMDLKIVLLIFESGNIVITGAKESNILHDAYNKIYPVLCKFKIN